jgi:F-type H+-transporting ATPase subunit delta
MVATKVAKRYAQALFELADEKKLLDDVARELGELRQCLGVSQELRNFIADPVLTPDQKKQVLRSLFNKQLNEFVLNFLLFLVDKRRLNLIDEIAKIFNKSYLEYKNIADVEIISAFPMDKKQVQSICQKIQAKFKKDVRSHVTTDADLIGGFKLRTQNLIYDFSFKTQLERFRQSISTI